MQNRIELYSEEYKKVIYDWNSSDEIFGDHGTLHELFEQQVLKTPDSDAIIFNELRLSYNVLNNRSNQLASYIKSFYQKNGQQIIQADTIIPICLERGLEMIIGILAVLKAGGSYLPIDPGISQNRFDSIITDVQPKVILSQNNVIEERQVIQSFDKLLLIDLTESFYNKQDSSNLVSNTTQNDLAYVIYTSGTTGKPKGVMVEHRAIVNLIDSLFKKYSISSTERFLLFSNYVFDASIEQIFLSLLSGGTLFIIDDETIANANEFKGFVISHKITHLDGTPSYLNSIDPSEFKDVKRVIFGAEYLSKQLFDKYKKHISNVFNVYGTTETVVSSLISHNTNKLGKADMRNIKAYVLSSEFTPVPVGTAGELYIGGMSLARGYLNLPDLTAERFLSNPFATKIDVLNNSTRLYKTGDLVKWTSEGDLEYIGRNDDQVKIRGYRIELGEVENAMTQIAGIKQACVLVKQNITKNGINKYLIGYYVLDSNILLEQKDILKRLALVLPEYMIPSLMIKQDAFPLTVNGKLNKIALPEPLFNEFEFEYTAPFNETEKIVCEIWEEILSVGIIGMNHDFFKSGGNSILAMEVISKLNKVLNRNCRVVDLLRNSVVSKFCEVIDVRIDKLNVSPVLNKGKTHHFEQLIFNHSLSIESSLVYNEETFVEFKERVNYDVFFQAVSNLIERYDVLNSNYTQDSNGDIIRVINRDSKLVCDELSINHHEDLKEFLSNLKKISFDIKTDKLIRFYLINTAEKQFVFIVSHHLILDNTSTANILLPELYKQMYLSVNDDCVVNGVERICEFSEHIENYYKHNIDYKREFWSDRISLATPLNTIDSDKYLSNEGGQLSKVLDNNILGTVKAVSEQLNISIFTALYGLFSVTVSKFFSNSEFVIATNIDERVLAPEFKNEPGCFINNALVINKFENEDTVSEFLFKCAESVLDTLENLISFSDLLSINRERVIELSDVHFNLETQEIYNFPYEQNQISAESGEVPKGLYFELDVKSDKIFIRVQYQFEKYDGYVVESLLNSYVNVLKKCQGVLNERITAFSLLDDNEINEVIYKKNEVIDFFENDTTIISIFEEQVKNNGYSNALVFQDKVMTYRELDEKSDALACYIKKIYQDKESKDSKGALIGLFLDRSFEMVIGMLSVLKAGATYIPIDPEYPKERVEFLLEDTAVDLILSQSYLSARLKNYKFDAKVVCIDLNDSLYFDLGNKKEQNYCQPEDIAYVIYTSGTTNKPKGVKINHKSVVNLILGQKQKLGITNESKVLQFASSVFDASVWEIYTALLSGAGLYIVDEETKRNSNLLCDYLTINKISVALLPPVFLSTMFDTNLSYLQVLLVGGDVCTSETMNRWSSGRRLINAYGPTENTVIATMHEYRKGDSNKNIGSPLNNMKAYVLDSHKNLLPIGAIGELYLTGSGLACGYLNREELTSERFVENIFATQEDLSRGYDKMYKTGDLVRYLIDGSFEYIGRNDNQVKVRGYRIELGEIESSLVKIDGIQQACVLVRESNIENNISKYLVGYYVLENSVALDHDQILIELSRTLPEYMVPSVLVLMDVFPITINGKLDKRQLPEPDFSSLMTECVLPTSELEKKVCEIWCQVLGIQKVGLTDNFFRLGGDSILATKLSHLMSVVLECDIKVSDVFKYKNIRDLLNSIEVIDTTDESVKMTF